MLALNGGAKKAIQVTGRETARAKFVTGLNASGDFDPRGMRNRTVTIADSGNNRVPLWGLAS